MSAVLLNPGTMIASLRGMVVELGTDFVIIECAGVGYSAQITARTAASLQKNHAGFIHTVLIVREDAMTLYGFEHNQERELFTQLLTVTGVGPKVALAILTTLTPEEIYVTFADSDIATLTKVPGIGKRVAERLFMELRDKLALHGAVEGIRSSTRHPKIAKVTVEHPQVDVIDALVGLGFHNKAATEVIDTILVTEPTLGRAELLKAALAQLGPQS